MPESSPDGWVLSDAALQKVIKAVRRTLGRPLNQRDDRRAGGGFGPLNITAATNNTGDTVGNHYVVEVTDGSAHVVGDELIQMVPSVVQATTTYAKQYGIVVGQAAENGDTVLVSLSGGHANYQGTAPAVGDRVGPASGAYAVSSTAPPYFTVVGVSTQYQLCNVVPCQPATISPVTLSSSVNDDADATVTLSDGRQVEAKNVSGQILESGNALCLADPHTGMYYLTGSAKPSTSGGGGGSTAAAKWFYGTVDLATDANMADGFNVANVVTLDGTTWPATSFQINNPLKLTGGDSDVVLFTQSSTARPFSPQGYVAANIMRRQPRFYEAALVSGGIASTDATGTVESVVALDGAPAPTTTTLTVSNPFNWSGTAGNYCRVVEKLAASSTVDEYILERVEFVKRQVLVASTWNSTSLIHNYISVPLPYTNETGTTVVFNTTQARTVETVASTGTSLVQLTRPLTVFAVGASTQETILNTTQVTVATSVAFSAPSETYSYRTVDVFAAGSISTAVVWTGSTCT